MAKYDASSITHLEGLEAIRKKPGMYAGVGSVGLHQTVYEAITNSVDEWLAGYGNEIALNITTDDGFIIRDNGRGIPFGYNKDFKMDTLDAIVTKPHTGGKMESNDNFKTSGGTHGIGMKIMCATCKNMKVEVWRDDKHVIRHYAQAKIIGDMLVLKEKTDEKIRGTLIEYHPDYSVWGKDVVLDRDKVRDQMKTFAYLCPGCTFIVRDDKSKKVDEYCFKNGLLDMYYDITGNSEKSITKPIVINADLGNDEKLDLVFGYTFSQYENIKPYCNNIKLSEGGTHVQGFKTAVTRALNDAARNMNLLKAKDKNLNGSELAEGMTAIINVKIRQPMFENQTKTKLNNQNLIGQVSSIVYDYMKNWCIDNPKDCGIIIDKILRTRRAREAAKKAREIALNGKQSKNTFTSEFMTKLVSCKSKVASDCELYVCEGMSAMGTLVKARNPMYQAIFPLRGKVLNAEKATDVQILANKELTAIMQALGCGVKEDYDEKKLRYDKIIIETDADVDGYHIRVLLLTFFYRFMPDLIKNGHVYTTLTPLYKVKYGKDNMKYLLNDRELQKWLPTIQNRYNYQISRFKGLTY